MNNSANETLKARAEAWTSPYQPKQVLSFGVSEGHALCDCKEFGMVKRHP